jgi:benzoyl-CoA reductase/2-hydroxyglutaryl-CoA dehydratase subunit BcrC/BadD/HgdB
MKDLELLADFHEFLIEKKAQGKKIIAFMGHDNIPEELIDAAGFFPLKLIFSGDEDLMNASHDYLPPSTCSFAQSCIGLFVNKPSAFRFLELIDYLILSNHCVLNICASEIITKYFSIPRINFYISYTQNENALKYYKLELMDLKNQLEKIKGSEIKEEEILESIRKFNDFKKKVNEISSIISRGKDKLKLYQKSLLYGPDFIQELDKLRSDLTSTKEENRRNSKNILLTGCSLFIGDELIDMIEESGGNILFFDTWVGEIYFSQIFDKKILNSNKNPLDLLVQRYEDNKYGDHSVPNFLQNKLTQLLQIIKSYEKKTGRSLAVINHIIKFCDHISIFSAFLKKELQERGFSVLNLERDYSRAIRGQLSTRIEAFMEMI